MKNTKDKMFLLVRNEMIYAYSRNLNYINSYMNFKKEYGKEFIIKKTKDPEKIKELILECFDLELIEKIPGLVLTQFEYYNKENVDNILRQRKEN